MVLINLPIIPLPRVAWSGNCNARVLLVRDLTAQWFLASGERRRELRGNFAEETSIVHTKWGLRFKPRTNYANHTSSSNKSMLKYKDGRFFRFLKINDVRPWRPSIATADDSRLRHFCTVAFHRIHLNFQKTKMRQFHFISPLRWPSNLQARVTIIFCYNSLLPCVVAVYIYRTMS